MAASTLGAVAPPAPTTPAAPPAAAPAVRLELPRRLPVAHDGQPLRGLSHSSYARFQLCPEDWRRYYLCGERAAPSGAMFLGSRVDDALTGYYRHRLEHREALSAAQLCDLYRDRWHQELAVEQDRLGVQWEPELPEPAAFQLGLHALQAALAELVPALGEPVAAQRRLEVALAPGLEWTVRCQLDLETIGDDGQPTVVDYKVKGSLIAQAAADRDPQAGLYLAARWLEGQPAARFAFAQVAKPGARRKQLATALVTTSRTVAQHRASLARIAQAASHIHALYERFGPDQPWDFADPAGWKCSERFCQAWGRCPGGVGL